MNTLSDLFNEALKPALDNSAQGVAALLAQIAAGVAQGGIPAIQDLVGKRSADVDPRILDFLTQLGQSVADQIYDQADDKIKELALQLTQALADFANGGSIGKRNVDAKFLNTLSDLFNEALKPALDNSAQGVAALLAQIAAGVAQGGIPAIQDLVG